MVIARGGKFQSCVPWLNPSGMISFLGTRRAFFSEMNMNSYYDIEKTIQLNPNCIVYMIVAERNIGKTYSTTNLLHKEVLKGNDFIYMRRYLQKELDIAKDSLFSRFTKEEGAIVNSGYDYFLLDEHGEKIRKCGDAIALSSLPKGVEFPNVKYIFFDEFSITDNRRYIKNEFDIFANFFETVVRRRKDIKVFMLGNSKTFYNPYTIGWNIRLSEGQRKWKDQQGLVYYEKVSSVEGDLAHENTLAGKLFKNTSYDAWAGGNNFSDDTGKNIMRKTKGSRYWCTIKNEGITFTIWYDNNYMYVSDSPGESRAIYNLDKTDIGYGESLFKTNSNQVYRLKMYASNGLLYFESEKIKKLFNPVMNKMLGY